MRLRVAKHTIHLDRIIHFYRDIIGLEVLGSFDGHDGYSGVFIGFKNTGWHLEFTTSAHTPQHQPDDDDLLVFYQPTPAAYEALKQKFAANHIAPVPSKNPYWNANGTCYPGPDGYLVVIAVAGIY